MTTIQTLQHELDHIQAAAAECVSPEGYVFSSCRYKYSLLIKQAKAFKESIQWMQDTFTNPTDRI